MAPGATSGGGGFSNGSATFSATGKGVYTLNPAVTSVTNHDNPPAAAPRQQPGQHCAAVQVNYYAQPAFALEQRQRRATGLSGNLTGGGASYTLNLNVPATASGNPAGQPDVGESAVLTLSIKTAWLEPPSTAAASVWRACRRLACLGLDDRQPDR